MQSNAGGSHKFLPPNDVVAPLPANFAGRGGGGFARRFRGCTQTCRTISHSTIQPFNHYHFFKPIPPSTLGVSGTLPYQSAGKGNKGRWFSLSLAAKRVQGSLPCKIISKPGGGFLCTFAIPIQRFNHFLFNQPFRTDSHADPADYRRVEVPNSFLFSFVFFCTLSALDAGVSGTFPS